MQHDDIRKLDRRVGIASDRLETINTNLENQLKKVCRLVLMSQRTREVVAILLTNFSSPLSFLLFSLSKKKK
jgi:S-adenosylmethionine:tRNA-ribosyltransferase-isomerase (queuine synthetase)